MSGGEGSKWTSAAFDFCIGVFLAAMALYGAVQILNGIWLTLCIVAAIGFALAGSTWLIVARFRRW